MTDNRTGLVFLPPAQMPACLAGLQAENADIREVCLRSVRNKNALLARFAQALDFGEGIGQNWDSLADALRDIFPVPAARQALLVCHCRTLAKAAPEDLQILLEILAETQAFYAEHGQPVEIVLDAELPEG